MAVTYNPYSPGFIEDPYPTYELLREEAPVHYEAQMGAWVLSRFDDVVATLRDHDTFSSEGMSGMGPAAGLRFLIFSDPPDHTKLRRLVNRPFTPSNIARLEPRVREICETLVSEMIEANEAGAADLITHVGFPLPVTVIAEMMGIPPERGRDFRRWSNAMIGSTSPDFDVTGAAGSTLEMISYFGEVVDKLRKRPGEDLINMLVTGAEPLTKDELIMFCVLLLIAGNETTTNLVGNVALAFFDFPDEVRRLREDPSLFSDAVDEALRYDSPVQTLGRRAVRQVTMHGVAIPEGAWVLPLYASANRDPRHFEDPATFRVDRRPTDHVAFGSGVHYCLGASLARLETAVLLETLLRRTRDLERAGPGERVHNVIVRGMRSLPVTFHAV